MFVLLLCRVSHNGTLAFKLPIFILTPVQLIDAGSWLCEVSNDYGFTRHKFNVSVVPPNKGTECLT